MRWVFQVATFGWFERRLRWRRDALESENELRRDVAARFVLGGRGAMRGWSRPSGPAVTIEQPPRQITIRWLGEGESAQRDVSDASPPLIDAKPVEGDDPSSEQALQRSPSTKDVGDRLIEQRDAIAPKPVASMPVAVEGPLPALDG
jgi:hypothetical protein